MRAFPTDLFVLYAAIKDCFTGYGVLFGVRFFVARILGA